MQTLGSARAQSAGFVVRQHYNMPDTDPRYLAMSDLDLRIEYYAIRAWESLKKTGHLPEAELTTEGLEDLEALLEAGFSPSDLEQLDDSDEIST